MTIILVNSPINVQQTIENCGRPSPFQNDKPSRGAEGESRLSETMYTSNRSFIYPVFPQLNINLCCHNKGFPPMKFLIFFFSEFLYLNKEIPEGDP